MKVNSETLKVIHKELPWLPDFLTSEVRDIKYQILDLDTLNLSVCAVDYEFLRTKIILIAKDGRVIGEVGRATELQEYPFKKLRRYLGLPTSRTVSRDFTETVDEALNRLWTEYGDVQYILRMNRQEATLYKVPKRYGFIEFLKLRRDEAGEKLVKFLREA